MIRTHVGCAAWVLWLSPELLSSTRKQLHGYLVFLSAIHESLSLGSAHYNSLLRMRPFVNPALFDGFILTAADETNRTGQLAFSHSKKASPIAKSIQQNKQLQQYTIQEAVFVELAITKCVRELELRRRLPVFTSTAW